ncbi:MAG: DUF3299 domain-containing protein [Hyphomicrobiaceae bacterium]
MLRGLLAVSCAAILALTVQIASSEALLRIDWSDLVPRKQGLENPFVGLTDDQRYTLGNVARIRELKARGALADDPATRADGMKYERQLTQQGIDVDGLLAEYQVFKERVTSQRSQLQSSLNGKDAKIAGYLIPLQFDPEGATEFLLVPYVGACIHTPPPPRNQIVYLRSKKPFKITTLFQAVWAKGRLSTKPGSHELSFVDGQRDIETGYFLEAAELSRYRS